MLKRHAAMAAAAKSSGGRRSGAAGEGDRRRVRSSHHGHGHELSSGGGGGGSSSSSDSSSAHPASGEDSQQVNERGAARCVDHGGAGRGGEGRGLLTSDAARQHAARRPCRAALSCAPPCSCAKQRRGPVLPLVSSSPHLCAQADRARRGRAPCAVEGAVRVLQRTVFIGLRHARSRAHVVHEGARVCPCSALKHTCPCVAYGLELAYAVRTRAMRSCAERACSPRATAHTA
jgi:hypothetical protein